MKISTLGRAIALLMLACDARASNFMLGANKDKLGRLINAAGKRFNLEYSNPEKTILNAYGKDYEPSDLFTVDQIFNQEDEKSISDQKYFAFNEENLGASNQQLFYALWSIDIQKHENFTTTGEWNLFNEQFMHNDNFLCSFDTQGCHDLLSLGAIRNIYPSRAQARLVYFTSKQFLLFHDKSVAIEAQFTRSQINQVGYIPDLVQSFTRQVEVSRVEACKLVVKALETAWNVGSTAAMGLLAGVPPPSIEVLFTSVPNLFKQSVWHMFGQQPANPAFPDWKEGKFSAYLQTLPEDGRPAVKALNFDPLSHLVYAIPGFAKMGYDSYVHKLTENLAIDQGYGKSPLCGQFRGDDVDRNPQNMAKLQKYLPDTLDAARKGLREQFRSISRGKIIVEGKPTAFAMIVLNNKWTGPGSFTEGLEHMEPVKDTIQRTLSKNVISDLLAGDGNYLACGVDPKAQQMCEDARYGRAQLQEGKELKNIVSKSGKKLNKATLAYICPPVPKEPFLICQAARIRYHKYSTHVVDFAGLQSFEKYHFAGLNMTFEGEMLNAFQYHLRNGNNLVANYDKFASGDVNGGGVRLGICMNPSIKMKDFGGMVHPHEEPSRSWEVPACCGYLCRDTQAFYKTIGIEMNGLNWGKREDGDVPLQIFRDRIPRVLERYSPAVRYLGWGNAGIHFPDSTLPRHKMPHNKYKFNTGVDKDFEMIKKATDNMTEFESNLWFCRDGKDKHTVFQRERHHVHLAQLPPKFISNSAKTCKQWLESRKADIKYWDNGGRL